MNPNQTELIFFVFGGFFAAILVVPRLIAWVARVVSACAPSEERSPPRIARFFVLIFLHSGPWLLVITAGVFYYINSHAGSADAKAFLTGFGIACALLVGGAALAYQVRRNREPPEPLTPELLRKLRRRFFVRESLISGGLFGMSSVFILQPLFGGLGGTALVLFCLIVLAGSAVFGLVASFIFWQWEWAYLGEREYWRRKTEGKKAM